MMTRVRCCLLVAGPLLRVRAVTTRQSATHHAQARKAHSRRAEQFPGIVAGSTGRTQYLHRRELRLPAPRGVRSAPATTHRRPTRPLARLLANLLISSCLPADATSLGRSRMFISKLLKVSPAHMRCRKHLCQTHFAEGGTWHATRTRTPCERRASRAAFPAQCAGFCVK